VLGLLRKNLVEVILTYEVMAIMERSEKNMPFLKGYLNEELGGKFLFF